MKAASDGRNDVGQLRNACLFEFQVEGHRNVEACDDLDWRIQMVECFFLSSGYVIANLLLNTNDHNQSFLEVHSISDPNLHLM